MFTGIIETLGKVIKIESEGTNKHFTIQSSLTNELKIDQSVAHNGVCLTVVEINEDKYVVTAVKETLSLTNLNDLQENDLVNLERCMPMNGRFDGHVVQGHVDEVATVESIKEEGGSWLFGFEFNKPTQFPLVSKGSITVNGTSLTVVNPSEDSFYVAIIPYTYENTVFKQFKIGDKINIEYDIIGKYVQALMERNNK